METAVISKKELLSETGISYGQLYRWKREQLIPEEWFIKQSSFTGQETFFPREKILERINRILELKESHSLEELAGIFSPGAESSIPLSLLAGCCGKEHPLFRQPGTLFKSDRIPVLQAALIFGLTKLETIPPQKTLPGMIRAALPVLENKVLLNRSVLLLQSSSDWHLCFCRDGEEPLFDEGIKIKGKFSLEEAATELQMMQQKAETSGLSTLFFMPLFGI